MKLALACAAVAALSLSGCAQQGAPSSSTIQNINDALAVGCPIVTAVQNSAVSLNSAQRQALALMALACPPNPPPTSVAVATADLISAIVVLQPLLAKH